MLTWIIISFVEELSFRGYIMQGLGRAWGMPLAVVVSSLLFGAVHALNPNANALGVANIVVVGILFACAYLVTRSLWLPVGLHIGWNLAEIQWFGFPGSGHTEPSLLHSVTQRTGMDDRRRLWPRGRDHGPGRRTRGHYHTSHRLPGSWWRDKAETKE